MTMSKSRQSKFTNDRKQKNPQFLSYIHHSPDHPKNLYIKTAVVKDIDGINVICYVVVILTHNASSLLMSDLTYIILSSKN